LNHQPRYIKLGNSGDKQDSRISTCEEREELNTDIKKSEQVSTDSADSLNINVNEEKDASVEEGPKDNALPPKTDSGIHIEAFEIEGLVENHSILPYHPSPVNRKNVKVTPLRQKHHSSDLLRIFIPLQEWHSIHKFCSSILDHEVMGDLLGEVFRDEEGPYLEVIGHIPSQHIESSSVYARQTTSGNIHFLEEKARLFKKSKVIGWYHTHPGLGIFLSPTDKTTKSQIFPLWYQIAVVIDPVSKEEGFFLSKGNMFMNVDHQVLLYSHGSSNESCEKEVIDASA